MKQMLSKKLKWLYCFWFLAIGCVIFITIHYRGEFTQFYGIAETKEISICSERSVEIKNIHVVPGQQVVQGELLVELYSPKLAQAINETTHKLKAIKAQSEMNLELLKGLESLSEYQTFPEPYATKNPLQISMEMLEKELSLLLEERNKHYMMAPISGIVGPVRCKPSEKISSYESILSLQAISPTYVRGYVHEFAYTKIAVGQKVKVISLADPQNNAVGEIIGVSSKIVEYPGRLKKMLEVQVYGREVQIKIPENNPFIMGEKLLINAKQGPGSFTKLLNRFSPPLAHANANGHQTELHCSGKYEITKPILTNLPEEASGIIYLKDIRKYLVACDDTPDNNPELYLINEQGQLVQKLRIPGIEKIEDMEAITQAPDDTLYILCSQKVKASTRNKEQRQYLISLKRDKTILKYNGKVQLHKLLFKAAQVQSTAWSQALNAKHQDFKLNIEGAFYHNEALFLGVKRPLKNNNAIILKINQISQVIEQQQLQTDQVSIWQELSLQDMQPVGRQGISALYFYENQVYLLTTAKATKSCGQPKNYFWVFNQDQQKLQELMCLEEKKPEGLTYNSHLQKFVITFDCGKNKPSKLIHLKEQVAL